MKAVGKLACPKGSCGYFFKINNLPLVDGSEIYQVVFDIIFAANVASRINHVMIGAKSVM